MAINTVLLVPDKSKHKFTDGILDLLRDIEFDKGEDKIRKLVLSTNIDDLKAFYILNMFVNSYIYTLKLESDRYRLKKMRIIGRLNNELMKASRRMYNLDLGLNKDYELNIDRDLLVFLINNIPSVDKKLFIEDNYIKLNFGIVLAKYFYIYQADNPIDFIVESYKLPYGDGTLLIVVVNKDAYTKIGNTFYKVAKDFLQINELVLSRTSNRDSLFIPFKLLVDDFVKKEMAKEPDVGRVILDNYLAHKNKSFLILPRARY